MCNGLERQLEFQCSRHSRLYLQERPREKGMRSTSSLSAHLFVAIARRAALTRCLVPKPVLSRSGGAARPGKWCWRLTWKARQAELEVFATRGSPHPASRAVSNLRCKCSSCLHRRSKVHHRADQKGDRKVNPSTYTYIQRKAKQCNADLYKTAKQCKPIYNGP